MTATLRQEFFLGAMPAGFEFSVTQVQVHGARGYNVGWRDNNNFNLSKVVTECYSGGRADLATKQRVEHGTICTLSRNSFSASIPASGKPARLGEMTWSKSTQESAFNLFLAGQPGTVELKFQVSDIKSKKVIAGGSFVATPEKFHILQRPDNIDVKLVWDNGQTKETKTEVAPDIGGELAQIHLLFAMGEDKKSLGMGFRHVQSTLNLVASFGVRLVIDVNKALLEWGVPGGAIIVTAIELPETVDTAIGLFSAGSDLADAFSARDPAKAHLALMKIIKGGYDIGGVIMNIKGFKSKTAEQVLGMIPPKAKDLAEGVLTKLLEEVVDKGMALEEGFVNAKKLKLRRQNLARGRNYLSYA